MCLYKTNSSCSHFECITITDIQQINHDIFSHSPYRQSISIHPILHLNHSENPSSQPTPPSPQINTTPKCHITDERITNLEAAYFRQQALIEKQQNLIDSLNKKFDYLYVANQQLARQLNFYRMATNISH